MNIYVYIYNLHLYICKTDIERLKDSLGEHNDDVSVIYFPASKGCSLIMNVNDQLNIIDVLWNEIVFPPQARINMITAVSLLYSGLIVTLY